jgi:hypothetical protein
MPSTPSLVLRCLAILVLAGSASAGEAARRILWFGNSYTYTNGIPGLLSSLAVAEGHPAPVIVTDLKGGSNLKRHLAQVTGHPASNVAHPNLAGGRFDFVIIQGHSHDPFDRAIFVADALAIFTAVRNDASGQGSSAFGILYQTWASVGDPTGSHKAVAAAYGEAGKAIAAAFGADAVRLSPVGEAFAQLKHDASLYKPDGSHPSPKGSLLSAMVHYRTIYPGELVGDLAYAKAATWAGVPAEEWTQLCGVADGLAIAGHAANPPDGPHGR